VQASKLYRLSSQRRRRCATPWDRQYVAELLSDVRLVAGHSFSERMQSGNMPPDDCQVFLRKPALGMGSVNIASATLDQYRAFSLSSNAANGPQVGSLRDKLRAVSGELVSLKSVRTTP
jgi:hypothetical protein